MDYPRGFPDHLKTPVDTAITDAEMEFARSRKAMTATPDDGKYLMKRYTRTVYVAFAHAGCEAVAEGLWTAETFRSETTAYLKALVHHIYFDKIWWSPSQSEEYEVYKAAKIQIENMDEWTAIQDQLKRAIRSSEAKQDLSHLESQYAAPAKSVAAALGKSIGEQLDDAILRLDISHEEQAERIGISRTTYFEVKAGRGGRKARKKTATYLSVLISDTSTTDPD